MRTPWKNRVALGVVLAALVFAATHNIRAELPQAIGTWASLGATPESRVGAAAVALKDGRTVITGGAVDGVATDSVVVFDPNTGSFSVVGHLLLARVGHTATLLDDDRILIAGGTAGDLISADLELFDPAAGVSALGGAMAQPRTAHAAAKLANGKVLIVGGTSVDGVLQNGEIYDPETGTTTATVLPMLSPRTGASATTLIDGRVLVAGGNNGTADLASAEIFEPSSQIFEAATTSLSFARSGHAAVLLPNNNSVLIAGGSSNGVPVPTSDLFLPAEFPDPYSYGMGSFAQTSDLLAARSRAIASPHIEGYAVAMGGGAPDAEVYRFPTIKTDKDDYAPGTKAIITGSGWERDSEVTLVFQEDPAVHDDYVLHVPTDGEGNFSWDQWAPEQHDLNVRFYLMAKQATADGVRRAQTTFTDSSNFSVTPLSTNVTAGSTSTFTWKFTGTNGSSGSAATLVVPATWPNPTGLVTVAPTPTNCTSASFSSITGTGPWTINITYSCGNNQSFNVVYGPVTAPTAAGTYPFTASPVSASPSVTVAAGAVNAAHSTVVASPASVAADGTTTSTITVTLKDVNDNPVSGKTVSLAAGSGVSTISAASGPSNALGVVTFTVKDAVPQAVTYTATDTTDSIVINQTATVTFTAVVSAANSTVTGTSPVVANGVSSSTVTITLKDGANNGMSGLTPTFSATDTGATNVYGACSATNGSGVSTCTLTSTKAEVKTLSIATPVVKSGGTVTFTAGPAAAPNSTITGTSPVVANGVASSTATITLQDAFSNPVSGVTPTFSATDTGATNVYGPCSATTTSGVSTCTLKSTTAEVKTLSIVTPVAKNGGTVTFTVGPLDHFKVEASGGGNIGTQTAGTAFFIMVTAQDAFNNTVTSFDANGNKVNISSTGTIPGGSFNTSAFTAGVLNSQSVTITNTGSFTITAMGIGGDSVTTGTSNPFTVNPGAPNKLAFAQQPTTATAGQAISPAVTVQIQDVNGNLTTSTASVGIAILANPSSGILGGTTPMAAISGTATFTDLSIDKGGIGYTLQAISTGLTPATSAAFTINNPAPTLTSIAPDNGNLSDTLNVVFNGTGFVSGVSSVNFGANITVNTTTVNSGIKITANITIGSGAAVGPRNVSVTNSLPGGGTAILTNGFTVNNPATTTSVTSSSPLSTSTYGDNVTFTATVTSVSGTPTGSVTFYDSASCSGTVLAGPTGLDVNGKAGFNTSSLTVPSHTITACYAPTGIYLASNGGVTQIVNKAALTYTASGNKTYGSTTDNSTASGFATFFNGDTAATAAGFVAPVCTSATGVLGTAAVGTYTINCAAGSADNYTLAAANFPNAFTVDKAALTYTASGNKTYGSTTDNSTASGFATFFNGDTAATAAGFVAPVCTSATGALGTAAVGTYTINCAAGSADNYTLAAANFPNAFTVDKAALTYTASGNKTYGSTTDNSTASGFATFFNGDTAATAAGFVAPVCTSATGVLGTAAVGTYTINCAAGSADNYTLAAANFPNAFTVDKAALTYTASGNKTYGSTTDNSTASGFATFFNGDTAATAAGFVAPVCTSATGALGTAAVGTYTINCAAGSANNYTLAAANFLNAFTVSRAHLTVTADNKNKVFDNAPFTAFTATITGFVNGESPAVVGGMPAFSTTPTNPAVNPGSYVIIPTLGGLTAGNYDFTSFVNGTLTIGYGPCNASVGPGGVILAPINSDGSSVYSRKGGSTIPVKFRVCDASGNPISNPAVVFSGTVGNLTMRSAVRGTIDAANESPDVAIPDVAFRWSTNQWIFNMATSNLQAGMTYTFHVNLAVGTIEFTVGVK